MCFEFETFGKFVICSCSRYTIFEMLPLYQYTSYYYIVLVIDQNIVTNSF